MRHVLAALAVLGALAFAGTAFADCGMDHTAQSSSSVTAQGSSPAPMTPVPPKTGG